MSRYLKNRIAAGTVGLVLSFNPLAGQAQTQNGADAEPEFNANFTLDNPLGGAGTQITVPVDCDLLEQGGAAGMNFLRQFDIWGHLTHETDQNRALNHLRTHGIMPEKVEKVRQYCLANFE